MRTRIVSAPLDGVLVVETDYVRDERGFFIESYHRRRYAELGLDAEFVQDNHSRSGRGVLRGLHYQDMRAPMAKLVRCTRGAIYDVAVDLRHGSPTFGQWYGLELTEANQTQLYLPVGFAHGFAVLSEVADVQYKCSTYYAPQAEGGVRWDDPELGIAWPIAEPVLSQRDRNLPSLADYRQRPAFRHSAHRSPA